MGTSSGGEATGSSPEAGRRVDRAVGRFRTFWGRVTEGLEVQQLWSQIQTDAETGYRLYAKEVDWAELEGKSKAKRSFRIARALFWAMLMKLSPARRVVLLVALVLLIIPSSQFQFGKSFEIQLDSSPMHVVGGLALLGLLAVELADRVTMKRDLEIAREIQRWLMPEVAPVVPGVSIAFASRPANTVAGDYYDAFLRPPSGAAPAGAGAPAEILLVAVADVAGKSVPAALLMATFQASLRTLAMTSSSLAGLAMGLNRYACAHNIGGTRFTTALLAEFDPGAGALSYVRAGQNMPVLRRASGTIERLEAGGLPFGIRTVAEYEVSRVVLARGDVLAIFTDGLVEAENGRGEDYGEERLLGILSAHPASGAVELLKELMGSVDAFVGNAPQHDDITCMIIRVV